ncbi:uncharacterized protein LOC133315467 [Gastrolobium bilobum]|uniref:uncharacterized protein LOC133315467 n=1 Tax=Gastrolobium bilobum TaxID=150636 RepID=UPI002AB2FE52|nr:uncharacterized protein LOC133315467 [Gastrolobium bilobum]
MARLLRQWCFTRKFEVIDLDNCYILVNFHETKNYFHVIHDGPWIVVEHYVTVQRWRPMFDPHDDQFKKLVVWIRIPDLPMELYTSQHLWRIGNIFGRTLKIDSNSLRKSDGGEGEYTEKAKYARICVEIDLRKIIISKFQVFERTFSVAYEGLHLICFRCGRYGHRMEACDGGVDAKEVQAMKMQEIVNPAEKNERDDCRKEPEEAFGLGWWLRGRLEAEGL